MIFSIVHNGSTHLIVDFDEIIGIAKEYCHPPRYPASYYTIILLKNGGRYKSAFTMDDEQFNKIRDNWLLARAMNNGQDVIIDV